LFFYDAAVFLYSSIERNDTRNFREKNTLKKCSFSVYCPNQIELYKLYFYMLFVYWKLSKL
ncbi:hypothetical protein GAX98_23285, partial [Phocaeicola vulgatus]